MLLVETAFKSEIRGVIPSEFVGNLLNRKTRLFSNYKNKVIVQERLFELCHGTHLSTIRVSTVGYAVAAVLANYDATANRAVYIHDMEITQNQLLSIIEEIGGSTII